VVDVAAKAVTVVVPGLLAKVTGEQRELSVPASGPRSVGDILDDLARDYPVFDRRVRNETGAIRRYVNFYLDGEDIRSLDGPETLVAPGQELLIIQSVAGG
jgi:sulfur-carrier protein